MTFLLWLACQNSIEVPQSPLSLPMIQERHGALKEKWHINRVQGAVQDLAISGRWGEAGVLAEQQFLLEPTWPHLETWLLNDSFSPYPAQWSAADVAALTPYLSDETQHVLGGLQALNKDEIAIHSDGKTVWGLWFNFRLAEKLKSSAEQKTAAEQLHQIEPTHVEACLYLIRERKVHRDYAALGALLKACEADKAEHPSLTRQLADFYDGIGEHPKALQLYTALGLNLHALVIAYQDGEITTLKAEDEVLLKEAQLDAALHSVWIGIHLQRDGLIRSGLNVLKGRQEPVAWAALGAGYLALGEPEMALSALESGDGVVVSTLRGRAQLALGDMEAAKQAFEEALLMQPWNPWVALCLAVIDSEYQEMVLKKDPLEGIILGHYRDRYRPWGILVPVERMTGQLDAPVAERLLRILFPLEYPDARMCEHSRACWALFEEDPQKDKRWAQLTPVEKRFVQVYKNNIDTDDNDNAHDRDWYASGLHRLIVLKTDNLP